MQLRQVRFLDARELVEVGVSGAGERPQRRLRDPRRKAIPDRRRESVCRGSLGRAGR